MKEKSCRCCNKKTKARLDDFHEIGWTAFRIGRGETYCFCPDCKEHCMEAVPRELKKKFGADENAKP